MMGLPLSNKPLMIDLFCGLGGWAEGGIAEGWDVIGFDIERHAYGEHRYPAQMVIQDVMTLDGAQFKSADLIVASPPCQEYSYMAMPWSRAKQIEADYKSGVRNTADLTALFDACFRIQREACEAAGRHIPMVVENVRGAQKWVGRSRFNYGSFHLWGDVPALMPMTAARQVMKAGVTHRADGSTNFHGAKVPGFRFDGSGKSFQSASVEHTGAIKNPKHMNSVTDIAIPATRPIPPSIMQSPPMLAQRSAATGLAICTPAARASTDLNHRAARWPAR